ncbi:MAG: hypothetical protein AB7P03_15435 [Kofleriaceae bacterium]
MLNALRFDLVAHEVERKPWRWVGGAIVAGYLLGRTKDTEMRRALIRQLVVAGFSALAREVVASRNEAHTEPVH